MNKHIINGIGYSKPNITLLQESGLGVSEVAARTCYDSFDKSENKSIVDIEEIMKETNEIDDEINTLLDEVNAIDHSDLLDKLSWTHFHHSILEHIVLSFLVRGTSRGVLQEHARHRIQAISVKSTRYTMSSIINAFIASWKIFNSKIWFINKIIELDILVTTDREYNSMEIGTIYDKLYYQMLKIGKDKFIDISVAKSSLEYLNIDDGVALYEKLEQGKKKRNVGDSFKHIVTDNFKVDMVVTFNIRSLKNYFELRDSGSAYFGIQWLAQEIKKVTPSKYLNLIVKR